jgi:hypothetical protein
MAIKDDIIRFKSKIIQQSNGCWHFIGAKDADGYGAFWFQGKTKGAHQFSARYLGNMVLQPGDHVCHHCDNPPCCNPDHLFVGSTQQNTKDRDLKNRTAKGINVGTSKLTEQQVEYIRQRYDAVKGRRGILTELANEFNVTVTPIWSICHRKGWRHL